MEKCDVCHKFKATLIESTDYSLDIGTYDILVCTECINKQYD